MSLRALESALASAICFLFGHIEPLPTEAEFDTHLCRRCGKFIEKRDDHWFTRKE